MDFANRLWISREANPELLNPICANRHSDNLSIPSLPWRAPTRKYGDPCFIKDNKSISHFLIHKRLYSFIWQQTFFFISIQKAREQWRLRWSSAKTFRHLFTNPTYFKRGPFKRKLLFWRNFRLVLIILLRKRSENNNIVYFVK